MAEKQLTYISLFAGIGGFDLALDRAGMHCLAQAEIDRKCRDVLAYHWPDVPRFEDVKTFGRDDVNGAVDLICGGWPCVDLSVAGARAGLAGERSGLFHEFARIIEAFSPTWVLMENVPGLLSSAGGRDMGIVTSALAQRGYWWAYRVLDAQHFGVPQRRRRVFIVGHSGNGRYPTEVLFESESLRRDTKKGGRERQIASALTASGTGEGGGPDDNSAQAGHLIAGSLTGNVGYNGRIGTDEAAGGYLIASALSGSGAGTARTGNERTEAKVLVINGNSTPEISEDLAMPLRANDGSGNRQAIVFQQNQREEVRDMGDTAGALAADAGAHQQNYIAFAWQQGVSKNDRSYPVRAGDYAGSVTATRTDAIAGERTGVRRLTPTECERLMGLPDGYTAQSISGTQSDSVRYRQLGNSVVVPVVEWIAKRIVALEERK